MKKIILLIISIFLFLPFINGFIPTFTHKYIHDQALKNPIDSQLYKACVKYPNLCYSGNVLNDVSVIFYYTARNKYAVTHSPNFCRALIQNSLNEKELACAVGGCMHQPADIVAHNELVPEAILNSFIVNEVIHVFTEQKVDNYMEKKYPFIKQEAVLQLNDFEECVPLFKRTLIGEVEYQDLSEEEIDNIFKAFIAEIQNSRTGYDVGFKSKSFFSTIKAIPFVIVGIYTAIMAGFILISVLLIFKLINKERKIRHIIGLFIFLPLSIIMLYLFIGSIYGSAFNNFVTIIKPISNLVPVSNIQYYVDKAVDNTQNLLTEGEKWLYNTDASGFNALDEANARIMPYDYLILIILSAFLIWFIWFLFKKNKL